MQGQRRLFWQIVAALEYFLRSYTFVVTDVTCYGNLYCVAGWDLDQGGMIRPEPPTTNPDAEASRFWTSEWIGPRGIFNVGSVIRLRAGPPPLDSPFPHATEDRIVHPGVSPAVLATYDLRQLRAAVSSGLSRSLNDIFHGQLARASSGKGYVNAGARVNSLGSLEFRPRSIAFHEEATQNGRRKLRAYLEQDGLQYDLSVPAVGARSEFLAHGIASLEAHIQSSEIVHARIGLCRPFAQVPDRCFVQINGLYSL